MKNRNLGEAIRHRRRAAGLTLGQIAVKVGVSKTALSKIERGLTQEPGIHTIIGIAEALQTTPNDLFIEAGLQRYYMDYEEGLLSRNDFYERKYHLEDQLHALGLELTKLEPSIPPLEPQEVTEKIQSLPGRTATDHLALWEHEDTVRLYKSIFRRIGLRVEVTGGNMRIFLNR